jgi:predicted PurR-regulated permease PerM
MKKSEEELKIDRQMWTAIAGISFVVTILEAAFVYILWNCNSVFDPVLLSLMLMCLAIFVFSRFRVKKINRQIEND